MTTILFPSGINDLHFEKAAFEETEQRLNKCRICGKVIDKYYYIEEGENICPNCVTKAENEIKRTPAIIRFIRAIFYGSIAAFLSSIVYYFIRDLTGYEIAFAAIGVGIIIGGAVRTGSSRKGGLLYQSLAIFLTYLSITSTFTPQLVDDFKTRHPAYQSYTAFQILNDGPTNTIHPDKIIINLCMLAGFSVLIPLIAPQNIILLIFILFGIFEAWKRNKPRRITPFFNILTCSNCGYSFSRKILSCPNCDYLVASKELYELRQQALLEESKENYIKALEIWRKAIDRLPPESLQAEIVLSKIRALAEKTGSPPLPPPAFKKFRQGSYITAFIAMVGWFFKKMSLFLIPKLSLIPSGLAELKTIIGMIVSFGFFMPIWGWQLALGLIFSLYIHEIGHIYTLKRIGISVTGLSFIPGFGAAVRLKQYPNNPIENSRVGLAGPMWGLWCSCLIYCLYLFFGWEGLKGAAKIGAWINLMNLVPILPLDGGRGFQALSMRERAFSLFVVAGMFLVTNDFLLLIILIAGIYMAFKKPLLRRGDKTSFVEYIFLIITLSLFSLIK